MQKPAHITNDADWHTYVQHITKGVFLSYEGNYYTSINHFVQAIQIFPMQHEAYFYKCNVEIYARKNSNALSSLEFILNKCSISPSFRHICIGSVYEVTGKTAKALEEYQKVLAMDAESNFGNYYVGNMLCDMERTEEALPYYFKAKDKTIFSPCSILHAIALAYHNLGKHDEAEDYYKQSLAAYPKFRSALINYARFLAEVRNKNDEAEAMLKQYRQTDPMEGSIELAKFYIRNMLSTREQDAKACLELASKYDPFCTHVHILQVYIHFETLNRIFSDEQFQEDIFTPVSKVFNDALKVLNAGLLIANTVEDVEELKAMKSDIMERGRLSEDFSLIDEHPEYSKWVEPWRWSNLKTGLFDFFLYANAKTNDYKYYIVNTKAGKDKVLDFVDVSVITVNR